MSYSQKFRKEHSPQVRVQLQAVASTLRAARGHHGWTIDQVADKTGLSPFTISYVERFKQIPSLAVLLVLAELYGLEFDLSWGGEPDGEG